MVKFEKCQCFADDLEAIGQSNESLRQRGSLRHELKLLCFQDDSDGNDHPDVSLIHKLTDKQVDHWTRRVIFNVLEN